MSNKITNVVSWFDDRFYPCKLSKQSIAKIQKRIKSINPEYELTVIADNIFLPSVTTILSSSPKEWLGRWRGQVGNWEADRIMNEALDKGSKIHAAFSNLIEGTIILFNNPKSPTYTKEQIEAISTENKKGVQVLFDQQEMLEVWRLKRFFDIVKPKIIGNEMKILSEVFGYAGTLDHLWYLEANKYDLGDKEKFIIEKSGYYILDIKTGKEDADNYPEQLASYTMAVEESGEYKIEGAIILYSNANKRKGIEGFKTDQYNKEQLEYHFKGFLDQFNIWIKKANKSPKVFDLPSLLSMN